MVRLTGQNSPAGIIHIQSTMIVAWLTYVVPAAVYTVRSKELSRIIFVMLIESMVMKHIFQSAMRLA